MNQDKPTIRALIEAKDYQIAELKQCVYNRDAIILDLRSEVDALKDAHAADKATVQMASAPGLRALLAERDKRIEELEFQTQSDSKLLHDHEKWMKWCDIKVLEENEELSCLIHKLAEALKEFGVHRYLCNDKGEHRMACPSNINKCDCGLDEALTKFNQWKESQT